MKKTLIILFSMALFLSVNGQNRKILTKKINEYEGKATYSYYKDDDFREVYHGPFTFIRNNTTQTNKFVSNVSGRYKKGERDGIWTYKIYNNYLAQYGHNVRVYRIQNITATVTYKNGLAAGSFNYSFKCQKQTRYANGRTTTEEVDNESVSTTFASDTVRKKYLRQPINSLTIKNTGEAPVTYLLNSEGFYRGGTISLKQRNNNPEEVYVVDNDGILDRYVNVNQLTYYPESYRLAEEDKAIFKKFQLNKDSTLLTDNRIEFKTKELLLSGNLHVSFALNESDYFEPFNCFIKYHEVKKRSYIPYKANPKWPNWRDYYSYGELVRDYRAFMVSQAVVTSKEDIEVKKKRIKVLEAELELENQEKEYLTKYEEILPRIEEIMNDPKIETNRTQDFYTTESQNGNKKNLWKLKDNYIASNGFYQEIHGNRTLAKSLFFKYKYNPDDFSEDRYLENRNLYKVGDKGYVEYAKASYEKLNEYIGFLESRKDSLIQANQFLIDITNNLNKLELISVEISGAGDAFRGAGVPINKSDFDKIFIETFKLLNKSIPNASNSSEYYSLLKQINNLCRYMVSVHDTKNNDLEKELKSASSVSEKHEIFQKYMNAL